MWKYQKFLTSVVVGLGIIGGWFGGYGFQVNAAEGMAKDKKPLERAFPHSNKCKRCHERVFEEWEVSPLAQSIHSAPFRVALDRYLDTEKNRDPTFCFRCHAPHILEYPEQADRFTKEVQSRDPLIDGVGCAQCHLVSTVDSTVKPPHPHFALGKTVFGGYKKPVSNLAHQSKALELFKSSTFCLICHEALPDRDKEHQTLGLLGDWKSTQANEKRKACQSCHMPEQFGESANGERNRKVSNHTFPGRLGELQQEAAELDIQTEVKGKTSVVTVTLQSLVPHNLPLPHPGWASVILDLTIKGKNLRKVYGENRVYTRVFADATGKETVFDFEGVIVVKDAVLKPEETRVETFSFPTPKDAPSMDVIVTLQYGPVRGPSDFLKAIERASSRGSNDPAFQPIDIVQKKINVLLK